MTAGVPIRLGTRGSALAMVQARWVRDRLEETGVTVELVRIQTAGDVRAPDTAWGEGAFVTAIEGALLGGRVDVAVHSAKDVPTVEDPRLVIAAWTVREDPHDALICRVRGTTLATLPQGSRVGTDSPRRTAFLRAVRPDLVVHPLSGNVDTRLRKLDEGESDALVLAVAGLTRLGHADRIDEVLPLDIAVPAPGQGALALQIRAGDERARAALAALDHAATRQAVEAERRFLRATGGGCRSPIGCLGRIEGDEIVLRAAARRGVARDGAGSVIRLDDRGPVADRLEVAERLAARIVRARRPRVLVTRPAEQAGPLVDALGAHDIAVVAVPTIEIRPVEPGGALDERAAALRGYGWVVVTSPNGARALVEAVGRTRADPRAARWAAVGQGTAAVLESSGVAVAFAPSRALGAAVAAELPVEPGTRVLLARGDLADPAIPRVLRERGAIVDDVVAYETAEAPEASRRELARALDEGPFDALAFASGSAVRGLLALVEAGLLDELRSTPAVCVGPVTGAVARQQGFRSVVEADAQRPDALAGAVSTALGLEPSAETRAGSTSTDEARSDVGIPVPSTMRGMP